MKHPFHASAYRPPFDSAVHRLDARVKLLAVVLLIVVVVSTPPTALPAFAGFALLLAVALAAARVPPGYVLARWLIAAPFILAALAMPFLHHDGPSVTWQGLSLNQRGLLILWNVSIKSTLAVAAMTLLAGSTHVADLLDAMRRLKVPAVLVMMVGLTWRYLFVLRDEAGRMRRARDLRHYGGRWLWQAGVVGRMIGVLFLRSLERAERVHAAMAARGFAGHYVGGHPGRLRAIDLAVLAGWSAVAILLRIFAA